jgi:hypothetical protein
MDMLPVAPEAHDAALPLPGDRVVCGLRFELPKNERGHDWTSLGVDTRHSGEFGEFVDMEIFACMECGRDKQRTIKVSRVIVDEAALDSLITQAKASVQAIAWEENDNDAMPKFNDCVEALNIKNVKLG